MRSMNQRLFKKTGFAALLAILASGNTMATDVGYIASLFSSGRTDSPQLPEMVREKQKQGPEEAPPKEPTSAELEYMSSFDPFINHRVAPIDPILKKKVDGVIAGKAFKSNNPAYDYFRYVTFYNVEVRRERVEGVPAKREQCHNNFAIFSGVDFVETISATVTATASYKSLGLTISGTVARTTQNRENFQASGGLVADHIPYFLKEDWYGRTFIETYHSKTRKFKFIVKEEFQIPFLGNTAYSFQFTPNTTPIKRVRTYPMPFRVIDKQWTFDPQRIIISRCNGGVAPIAPPTDAILLKNSFR